MTENSSHVIQVTFFVWRLSFIDKVCFPKPKILFSKNLKILIKTSNLDEKHQFSIQRSLGFGQNGSFLLRNSESEFSHVHQILPKYGSITVLSVTEIVLSG